MSGDFGPYGKGLSGYVHYAQAVDEARRGGRRKPPQSKAKHTGYALASRSSTRVSGNATGGCTENVIRQGVF